MASWLGVTHRPRLSLGVAVRPPGRPLAPFSLSSSPAAGHIPRLFCLGWGRTTKKKREGNTKAIFNILPINLSHSGSEQGTQWPSDPESMDGLMEWTDLHEANRPSRGSVATA